MEPLIKIRRLKKRYGEFTAVDGISFDINKNEIFGLLGPNGAGKSTTIGCLTGLLDPTAGCIRLLGERFNGNALALKRRIGVMPENLGLFEALYAHEFLAFQARIYGLDEKTTRLRVAELLEAMQISGQGKKPIAEFSSGMRKRLAFSAAIRASSAIRYSGIWRLPSIRARRAYRSSSIQ